MHLQPQYHTLKNGTRLVHIPAPGPVGHLGVFINTGTRDEPEGIEGLAHFIEHMIFKGTRKRKAYHILNRMESVGGDINAFTTKEYTCIYTSFLSNWYGRAAELLSDIALNSIFPHREMEKEKDIIIDEINSYLDTPSEQIYDDFEGALFRGHAMGRSILGKPENIKAVRQEDLTSFYSGCYDSHSMVICSVGGISTSRILKYVDKYFEGKEGSASDFTRQSPAAYLPFSITGERKTYQSHTIIGNRAFARGDNRRFAFGLLNNVLGGPGMNSRLNMLVREKYGYAYSIDSFYFPYSDTGVWGIYLGTDNGSTSKATKLIMKELSKMRNTKLGSLQLSQAKKQYLGQIAIAFDSNVNVMLSGGRSYLFDKKILSIEDIYARIEHVTANDLMEIAEEVFSPDQLSTLTYKASWNS
ncbi:MAG: pitrilysin family protein [Bacteroidales bacterium]|nr:pitrilysin family protein [Bacteroidales bacterium]